MVQNNNFNHRQIFRMNKNHLLDFFGEYIDRSPKSFLTGMKIMNLNVCFFSFIEDYQDFTSFYIICEASDQMPTPGTLTEFIGHSIMIEFTETNNELCYITARHPCHILDKKHCYKVYTNQKVHNVINSIGSEYNLSISCINQDKNYEFLMQYDETVTNFLNRICFENSIFWKCNPDGSISCNTLDFFSKKGEDFKEKEFMIIEKKRKQGTFAGRAMNYNTQNPAVPIIHQMNEGIVEEEYIYFNLENKSEATNIMVNKKSTMETRSMLFVCYKKPEIFQTIILEGMPYFVSRVQAIRGMFLESKFVEYNYYIVEAKNVVSFRDFQLPKAFPTKARVLAPTGSLSGEVFQDEKHRICVEFFFDKEKKECFIPLKTLGTNGLSTSFLPRANAEVVVEFFNGNPSFPFVSGALYNQENKLKFSASDTGLTVDSIGDKKKQSGIVFSSMNNAESLKIFTPKDISHQSKYMEFVCMDENDSQKQCNIHNKNSVESNFSIENINKSNKEESYFRSQFLSTESHVTFGKKNPQVSSINTLETKDSHITLTIDKKQNGTKNQSKLHISCDKLDLFLEKDPNNYSKLEKSIDSMIFHLKKDEKQSIINIKPGEFSVKVTEGTKVSEISLNSNGFTINNNNGSTMVSLSGSSGSFTVDAGPKNNSSSLAMNASGINIKSQNFQLNAATAVMKASATTLSMGPSVSFQSTNFSFTGGISFSSSSFGITAPTITVVGNLMAVAGMSTIKGTLIGAWVPG